MTPPIISIIGKSNSGKTTLLEKLLPALQQRGYRVAVIKHHAHAGFEIDQAGKDTWRFAQAGSDVVVIAAPDKLAMIERLPHELSLDELAQRLQNVDLILTEGFKRAGKPAIEVIRKERSLELIGDPNFTIAVASDTPLQTSLPVFNLDDAQAIAAFIAQKLFPG